MRPTQPPHLPHSVLGYSEPPEAWAHHDFRGGPAPLCLPCCVQDVRDLE